jgi:hypothetical protein
VPFLLYPSSPAFLEGDMRGILERFRFRRDALDYLAMAGIVAGMLLLIVGVAGYAGWLGGGSSSLSAAVSAVVLIAGGAYFVNQRHSTAEAHAHLIRDGKVLPGTLITCSGRVETAAEATLGEVSRAFLVTVEYHFTTPDGEQIVDHAEHSRPDLRRAELPAAGTEVLVLYLDDRTYALL